MDPLELELQIDMSLMWGLGLEPDPLEDQSVLLTTAHLSSPLL